MEDTYTITRKLTFDLGLRYDLYTTVKPRYAGGAANYDSANNSLLVAGVGGVSMSTGIRVQATNFAPRLGAAYRIGGKTVVRGGFGISYWEGRFGFTGGTLDTQYPAIYNLQVGSLNDYLVGGGLNTIPAIQLVAVPGNGIISPAPNQPFFEIPFNNPLPYVESYNVIVQRQISSTIGGSVGYVGNVGRELPYTLQLNAAAPGTGNAGLPLNQQFGRTASTYRRGNGQSSNYNSLQATIDKRFSHGLNFTVAYAFSKALDGRVIKGVSQFPTCPPAGNMACQLSIKHICLRLVMSMSFRSVRDGRF